VALKSDVRVQIANRKKTSNMSAICFRKPEVVITQPLIEMYQTSAVIKQTSRNKICDAMTAILRNRYDLITAPDALI